MSSSARSKVVPVRLSAKEYRTVTALAKKQEIPVSTYLRNSALGVTPVTPDRITSLENQVQALAARVNQEHFPEGGR